MEPTTIKNPFQSRTVWGLIITAVGMLGGFFGVDVDKSELTGIVDQISANWDTIAQVIGLLVALWGRLKATKPIGFNGGGAGLLMLALMPVFIFSLPATAGDNTEWAIENHEAIDYKRTPSFSLEGYSTGAFLSNHSSGTVGGGTAIGWGPRKNLRVSINGEWFYATQLRHQKYTVEALLYSNRWLQNYLTDYAAFPHVHQSRLYALAGGGTISRNGDWYPVGVLGGGIEIPLTPDSPLNYFIDGQVVCPATRHLENYVAARTGIRVRLR